MNNCPFCSHHHLSCKYDLASGACTSPAVTEGGGQAELTPGHPCSHRTTDQGGLAQVAHTLLATAMLDVQSTFGIRILALE